MSRFDINGNLLREHTYMYAISFEIAAFLLSLFCFLYCLIAKRKQYIPPKGVSNRVNDQHFQFLMMLLSIAVSSIVSVTGVFLTTLTGDAVLTFWKYFFHALYFIFHTTLSLAFGLYIVSVTGTDIKKNKILYLLFFLPYTIAEALILTNQWTNWCFFMDENSIYHRGVLMPLLYGLAAFYIVMGFIFFIRNMKAITRDDSIAVGVFIIIATIGIIVQAVRSDILVELFAEALACLVIMMVLEEKAGHVDQMTGLLNRFAFSENVRRMLASKSPFTIVAIQALGISSLIKRFNERSADQFLLQFATYLSLNSGEGTAYSYRRGEFLVLFKNDGKSPTDFASKVISRFDSPWRIGRVDVSMSVMAALVHSPEDIRDYDELEDFLASFAGYRKNQEGSYLVPDKDVKTMIQSRAYEDELQKVVKKKQLEVYFQPIYSLNEHRTVSAEALLRINVHPFTEVSPELYIPIAERTGLIYDIGLFVFEEVCKFLAAERTKATPIRYVELNLSVYQFLEPRLVDDFEKIRRRYGIDAGAINLEITETGGALDKNEVLATLKRFIEIGYTLSLDDFGTGYSNFVRMVRCQFENIKIDKSILWDLGEEKGGKQTLQSLASFIKLQGSRIVQEGVETKQQYDLVESCGADYIQGFYFSKPLTKEGFYDYLDREGATIHSA
ncbi:MAG: EAL domain-containing protein [Bacilli bacterium]|nr:EAL domain-containing protein [Bacilli bacterium]